MSSGRSAFAAFTIDAHAMNESAASGFPRTFAAPPSSTISSGVVPSAQAASSRSSFATFSAAPFAAPSPVTAN